MIAARLMLDSSIYIPFLRGEAYRHLVESASRSGRVVLSAVVLSELYAGTRSHRDQTDLDVVKRSFDDRGLLIVPSGDDWARTGQAIRRHRALYGALKAREHVNDLLTLLGAARTQALLVTENAQQFKRWARLLRKMGSRPRLRALRRSDYLDA